MTTKKIICVIVVVLALIVVITLINKKGEGGKRVEEDASQQTLQVRGVAQTKTPDGFPANFPIEKDAVITQNYNATSPEGQFQATRVFITKKTLDENYSIYEKFLLKEGWKITASVKEGEIRSISASKDNNSVNVTITENSISKVKTVDISYIISPFKQ